MDADGWRYDGLSIQLLTTLRFAALRKEGKWLPPATFGMLAVTGAEAWPLAWPPASLALGYLNSFI